MSPIEPRQLLILDLDETLIYAQEKGEPTDLPPPAVTIPDYHIWKRPFLDLFIETVMVWFDVAV